MPKITVELASEQPLSSTSDTFVMLDFEDLYYVRIMFEKDAKISEQVKQLLSSGDFKGKDGQVSVIYTNDKSKPRRLLLVGLGVKEVFHLNKLRVAVAQAVNFSRQIGVSELVFPVISEHLGLEIGEHRGLDESDAVCAVAEACILANHKFDSFKSDKPEVALSRVKICVDKKDKVLDDAVRYACVVAENCCMARDIVNLPASTTTPEYVSDFACTLFKGRKDVKCTVFDRKALQRMGANGIVAVSSGSGNEPRMLLLEYSPESARKSYALVGKGVTFDSGGLNLKPAPSMEHMKTDMSGAASVIFTVLSAAQLNLQVRVIGMVAMVENLLGPGSYKPGDIIRMMGGKTVEVLNTDAEGRIILADALYYVQKFNPDYIVDIATLTGACFIALGSEASGVMGNDPALIRRLKECGDRTFERVWELPLYDEYQNYIKSDFADVKNVVSNQPGTGGGAVTAGKFLSGFVGEFKWAHLDIAGTAWSDSDSGYNPRGATGVGVRLLSNLLSSDSNGK